LKWNEREGERMEGYFGNGMRKKKRGWKALLQIDME